MRVVLEATHLPGRRLRPSPGREPAANVHVGVCVRAGEGRWAVRDLVAGDAAHARWRIDVELLRAPHGYDFAGPFVGGPPYDRRIRLAWGNVDGEGRFRLLGGSSFSLCDVPLHLVDEAALEPARVLVARVSFPNLLRTGRVNEVAWMVEDARALATSPA